MTCPIRYLLLAILSAVFLGCHGEPSQTVAPSDAEPVTLEREWEEGNYRYEFYRNRAFTCAIENFHTFLLVYDKAVPITDPAPLWIRLHGGAGGAFDATGEWVPRRGCDEKPPDLAPGDGPRPCFLFGEEPGYLSYWLRETGLVARAKEEGFRFLVPSGCDHDLFSGIGGVDPNNPHNPDENGNLRRVDGLSAVRAALDFARKRLATTHIVAHGTSAGSMGAFSLVAALGREGKAISGAILDSSVVSPYMLDLAENGCLNHDRANVTLYHERIGFYWRKENMGHAAMAAGTVGTPIYDFWSRRDRVCDCTEVGKITVTDSEGNTVTDTGCNLQHGPFDDALEQHNPGGASRVRG